jgi:hypothetical protein
MEIPQKLACGKNAHHLAAKMRTTLRLLMTQYPHSFDNW